MPIVPTSRPRWLRLQAVFCSALALAGLLCVAPASVQAQSGGTLTPSKRAVSPASAPTTGSYAGHGPAMAFAQDMAQRNGWPADWAQNWVGQAQRNPTVLRLMAPTPTGVPRNWEAYRDRFIEPVRTQAGLRFWQDHAATLQRAEAEFGVPAWLIVGIIGVETLYGQHTGRFRVLDALTTLAFDFPPEHPRAEARAAFFRGELEALLTLSRKEGVAPDTWLGSFAGAMGLPQFMPSNIGKFGVDFDADGHIDLRNSPADAIGSVARYLQGFGWQAGMQTHFPVAFDAGRVQLATLMGPDILPTFTAQQMQELGAVLPPEYANHSGKLALVELENGPRPRSYVVGTENFYVITRYNQSSYYAMAVIELGRAVEALMRR